MGRLAELSIVCILITHPSAECVMDPRPQSDLSLQWETGVEGETLVERSPSGKICSQDLPCIGLTPAHSSWARPLKARSS